MAMCATKTVCIGRIKYEAVNNFERKITKLLINNKKRKIFE